MERWGEMGDGGIGLKVYRLIPRRLNWSSPLLCMIAFLFVLPVPLGQSLGQRIVHRVCLWSLSGQPVPLRQTLGQRHARVSSDSART